MRTVVSIPGPLFARAEDLARRLGKSRSQLYAEAIGEYVARHKGKAVSGLAPEDKAVLAAGARTNLDHTEW